MRASITVLAALLIGPVAARAQLPGQGEAFGEGTFEAVPDFGANPGALAMYRYVPASAPEEPAPLVVAFHACSETAADYRKAGWEPLADELGFYVLYPEQNPANNALRCFNWGGEYGDPTNLRRGEGENQSIRNMIAKMAADFAIDETRIFATGQSGGGAQVALMLATWPDLFAAGGIIAGIPYNCTTNFNQVASCLNPGLPRSAQEWGDAVRAAFPEYEGPYPRVAVMHGTADGVVNPVNLTEIMKQWTNVHGTDQQPDDTEQADGVTHKVYRDAGGAAVVETWELAGAGHGVFVDPDQGCGATGAFFLDADFCSSRVLAEFFGLTEDGGVEPPPGDRQPPTVDIVSPADGAMVEGVVRVEAEASDDTGVVEVELFANGRSLGVLDAPPYRVDWDTSAAANGVYLLRAVARDAAGNEGVDEDTEVTVAGAQEDVTPPTVRITGPADGAEVRGAVTVTAEADDDFGVTRVTFRADGAAFGEAVAPPYTATWDASAVSPGVHTLTAVAVDAAGNEAESAAVAVRVAEPDPEAVPPEVSFTAPAPGETLSGIATITVEATHPDGVTQVILFLARSEGDEPIGTDRAAPFEFLWDTALVEDGTYRLVARAFEPGGAVGIAEREIAVDNSGDGSPGGDGGIDPGDGDGTAGGGDDGVDGGPRGPARRRIRKVGRDHWGCAQTSGAGAGPVLLAFVAMLLATRRQRR